MLEVWLVPNSTARFKCNDTHQIIYRDSGTWWVTNKTFLLCLPLLASFVYFCLISSHALFPFLLFYKKLFFFCQSVVQVLKSMEEPCYTLHFHNSLDFNKMVPHCYCSVTELCATLCNPMDCSTTGFSVLHYLDFAHTHVHWVGDAIQPSHPLIFSCPQSFQGSGSFPLHQLFASGGQSIGVSASASVLPRNIQG